MRKKLVLPFILIFFTIFLLPVSAQESITLKEAYNKALNNDKAIVYQSEITESLKKEYDKYKTQFDYVATHYSDPLGNIKKIPYNFPDKADYNYKDLKRNEMNLLKSMIVGNKEKTFNLFVNELNLRNDIKNLKSQISYTKTISSQENMKFKSGLTLKVNVMESSLSIKNLQDQLSDKENQLRLNEKKFEDHVGIKNAKDLEFKINAIEDIMVPEEALKKAEKEKVSFDNLNHEIQTMKDQIEIYYKGPATLMVDAKLKKEDLDKKIEDLNDLKNNTLNKYERFNYDILIAKNQLLGKKIEFNSLKRDENYHRLMFNAGMENANNLRNCENKVLDNLIARETIQLNIDKISADYVFDTEN